MTWHRLSRNTPYFLGNKGPHIVRKIISPWQVYLYGEWAWLQRRRSRLTPERGLDQLGGPELIEGVPRPWSRYGVPDPTNRHWHIYCVSLKYNFDWLTLGNDLNNMYHMRKLVSRHKDAYCPLNTNVTFVWKYDAVRHAVKTSILRKDYPWCPMMTTS